MSERRGSSSSGGAVGKTERFGAVATPLAQPVPVRPSVGSVLTTFGADTEGVLRRLKNMESVIADAMVKMERMVAEGEEARERERSVWSEAQYVMDTTVQELVKRLKVLIDDSVEKEKRHLDEVSVYKKQVEQLKQLVVTSVKSIRHAVGGGTGTWKSEGEPEVEAKKVEGFSDRYPEGWVERYTRKEVVKRAERSLGDYGKSFVEYRGRWYEAVRE